MAGNPAETEDLELPVFDLFKISKATSNFASQNRLGEGGFGPVYKVIQLLISNNAQPCVPRKRSDEHSFTLSFQGKFENGQEIAVKRLSETSKQGFDEFKNEVIFIAKLQHRNLVKLLGCCIQEAEKMLIYEYMPNRSLDTVLFGN